MDVDATLLESGSSLAPGGFRGVQRFGWLVRPLFPFNHAFAPYCLLASRDPLPTKPSIYIPLSTSTLTIGQQHLLSGYSTGPHTPSLHKKVSSSSHRPLQLSPKKSNYSIGPPPPESRSRSTGLDDGGGGRPHDRSQDPPSEQRGLVTRMPSRRSTTGSEPSPMPVDPQPFDYGELQRSQARNQVYGPPGGTGKSHTDLQNTRGGRTASKRDVSGKGSRRLLICEVVFAIVDNGVEFDLNRDLDDNDEGKYWSGPQRDNRGASCMSRFLSFPTRHLTYRWRFGSESKWHETSGTQSRWPKSQSVSYVSSSSYVLEADGTLSRWGPPGRRSSKQPAIRQIQCVVPA